jgi:O-methyltransferase
VSAARTAREVVHGWAPAGFLKWVRRAVEHTTFPVDMTSDDIALYRRVAPFTMTSPERVIALRDAVLYLSQLGVAGDFVECGVWRGGSMMVVAEALSARSDQRRLHLFDTFEGMSAPGEHDRSHAGDTATQVLAKAPRRAGRTLWCIADEEDVRRNLASTGYPMELVRLVRGKVEQTLPAAAPERIALLRLDTDWYESTRHELEHLYPRVVPGGIVIIDDYGYWQGARKAVDEYISTLERRPLLSRVDSTGRLIIKP